MVKFVLSCPRCTVRSQYGLCCLQERPWCIEAPSVHKRGGVCPPCTVARLWPYSYCEGTFETCPMPWIFSFLQWLLAPAGPRSASFREAWHFCPSILPSPLPSALSWPSHAGLLCDLVRATQPLCGPVFFICKMGIQHLNESGPSWALTTWLHKAPELGLGSTQTCSSLLSPQTLAHALLSAPGA